MGNPRQRPEKILGEVIKAERDRLNISQEALAHESGLNKTFMGEIERGEKMLSLESLLKVAAGLKMRPGALLDKAKF